MNFVVKSSRSQDKLIMTDLENFNTLNHARKLLWHFPCYRYEFLTIIEIMYELEMYMLLEHNCLQNKILVVSAIHTYVAKYFLFNFNRLYYTMIIAGWQKLGIGNFSYFQWSWYLIDNFWHINIEFWILRRMCLLWFFFWIKYCLVYRWLKSWA